MTRNVAKNTINTMSNGLLESGIGGTHSAVGTGELAVVRDMSPAQEATKQQQRHDDDEGTKQRTAPPLTHQAPLTRACRSPSHSFIHWNP